MTPEQRRQLARISAVNDQNRLGLEEWARCWSHEDLAALQRDIAHEYESVNAYMNDAGEEAPVQYPAGFAIVVLALAGCALRDTIERLATKAVEPDPDPEC